MNIRKCIALILAATLIVSALGGCGGMGASQKRALDRFSKEISKGRIDDISLTIYYTGPENWYVIPPDADELIRRSESDKIVVSGTELKEHIDILSQINGELLVPVKGESYVNAVLHYVFKDKHGKRLFDVTIWDLNGILVNGLKVEAKDIFFDIVLPFLPEDMAKRFEKYKPSVWPEFWE